MPDHESAFKSLTKVMFGKIHIHRNRLSLCHSGEGAFINFEDADGMNPDQCCDDCQRRFKNITGIDLHKPTIDKALLRAKTERFNQ